MKDERNKEISRRKIKNPADTASRINVFDIKPGLISKAVVLHASIVDLICDEMNKRNDVSEEIELIKIANENMRRAIREIDDIRKMLMEKTEI